MTTISIILPAKNEAEGLRRTLPGLRARFPDAEILVVDDGSTDGSTGDLATTDRCTLLHHPVNQGKGAALLTGFAAAQQAGCDWAITIDADGQHRPSDARAFLEIADGGRRQLVVGCREGMHGANVPWTSRFGRGFSNFWVWMAGGPRLRDSQSGFRLYPLPEILACRTLARRYQFEVEILVAARRHGLPVSEVPVSVVYQPKGEQISHFHPWRDFGRNAATFSRLIWRRIFSLAP